jgi:hypothetical protein
MSDADRHGFKDCHLCGGYGSWTWITLEAYKRRRGSEEPLPITHPCHHSRALSGSVESPPPVHQHEKTEADQDT